MLSTVLGFALLVLLAVTVLPVPRVQRWLLTATARLGRAVVLAFLGACDNFFVQPQAAPDRLTGAARPLLEATLGLSLPPLLVVELALNLSCQNAHVQALRREILQSARWVDSSLAALGVSGPTYSPMPDETTATAEALRSVGSSGKQPATAAPLVLDLLK